MSQFTRKWWGGAFISALESFTQDSRLQRGRAYARNGKIVEFSNTQNVITATVQGSINPYFGVYEIPYYNVQIKFKAISENAWKKVVHVLGSQAYYLSHLLMREMPDDIEQPFQASQCLLLPASKSDFIVTKCSCPDYAVPCKHIAGVYYLIASQLDENPFLLFELRGLPLDQLIEKLETTPLGKALAQDLAPKQKTFITSNTFFPELVFSPRKTSEISSAHFWHGRGKIPSSPAKGEKYIPAVLIKKQGDFPPFWEPRISFISWMEGVYEQINKSLKRGQLTR